ncbi:hydrogenase/urease accessory protein [Bradyrhizobium sp. Y36]|uniref:HupE/UreJ family protein n=1 Tax=Bradyrhizobium sp. Y36 TaxID=2035447 RepID=UPI000BEA1482|nr:HupE/UreJ family protein [Bradyrhizobium sp. Y36]PDT87259.1 hydrogenase/urease accessory protein [Bradyrhizobium sp. Y36]
MIRPQLLWLAVLLGLCLPAEAHQVNLVTARVALAGDRTVSVELGLKGSDIDRLIGAKVYDTRQDTVDPAAVEAAKAAIFAYLDKHLAVTSGATPCPRGDAAILPDGDGVVYRSRFACASIAGAVVYRSSVLTETDPTARQVVLIARDKSETQALLDAGHTSVTLSATPSSWPTIQRYLLAGIEHIFLGYDHIAFLIAVMLWARRLIPVIKIVTAFTVAHSITLSLAALNLVVVAGRIVEPAIAASIIFVAVENFVERDIDRRWRVAFLFGLIHGFGFAGVLREVGLPPNAIVPALGAFNIGVEVGQIAIVAIVLQVLGTLDRLTAADRGEPVRAAKLVYAVSAAISLLGSYWLIMRVLEA